MEKTTFVLLKRARVDSRGRFYIPESICRQVFASSERRRVQIYMDAEGRILLIPEKTRPVWRGAPGSYPPLRPVPAVGAPEAPRARSAPVLRPEHMDRLAALLRRKPRA